MSKYGHIRSIAELEKARSEVKKKIVSKQVDIYLDVQDIKERFSPTQLVLSSITSLAPNLLLHNVSWPLRRLLLLAVRKVKSKLTK